MNDQSLPLDIISTLPSTIIETILCLVPIQEAVRTSILSKGWRYNWTKIPKLVFDEYVLNALMSGNQKPTFLGQTSEIETELKIIRERSKVIIAIYQVLLLHQGPITDFTLEMEIDKPCVELDHIISYLSKNKAVKKLKLHLPNEMYSIYHWIPLSIFSLQQLTHLHLYGCDLNRQPTFNGFGSLTNLYLKDVYISSKNLLHLLSNCPLLKTFTLLLHGDNIIHDDCKYSVFELLQCLPKIEHLTTWSWIIECFVLDSVPQELPTLSLTDLKHVSFTCMSANDLYLLVFLMRCSPNLEKIKIKIYDEDLSDEMTSVILAANSNIRLNNLNELCFEGFAFVKSDLKFVKFILAKSPKLKKVHLILDNVPDTREESEVLRILLRPPPASSVLEIFIE